MQIDGCICICFDLTRKHLMLGEPQHGRRLTSCSQLHRLAVKSTGAAFFKLPDLFEIVRTKFSEAKEKALGQEAN